MCLICFNKAEIEGEVTLGNTYRIKAMGESFNFTPVSIQNSQLPCYGRVEVLIGYTDMRESYTEAMQRKIAQYGNVVDKTFLPTVDGTVKMVLIEKYHKNFNIEDGIEESMEDANRLRR